MNGSRGIISTDRTFVSYLCKLVVEHPQYIYLFGDNEKNPERMVMVFMNPDTQKVSKSTVAELGFAYQWEARNDRSFKKVLLASKAFNLEKKADQQYLDSCLKLNDGLYAHILSEDEDFALYERLQEGIGLKVMRCSLIGKRSPSPERQLNWAFGKL